MVTSLDIKWAAGFLEGEGSFMWLSSGGFNRDGSRRKRATLVAYQNQEWPLLELCRIFGGAIGHRDKRTDSKIWIIGGSKAIQIMMTLYIAMSPRRRGQILKVLLLWREIPAEGRYRTHCPKGHAYTNDNTIHAGHGCSCRTCARDKARAWKLEVAVMAGMYKDLPLEERI